MAMQTEQEEDSNGNHPSDVTVPSHHDKTRSDVSHPHPHHHQRLSPVTTKPSQDILLHGSRQQQQQQQQQQLSTGGGTPVLESIEMAPRSQVLQSSRPGQLFPSSDPSVSSPEECGDSYCNIASSAVDSDSSSSPDINSNTLIVGFGQSDLPCPAVDNGTSSGTPSSDQVMLKKMAEPDNKSSHVTVDVEEAKDEKIENQSLAAGEGEEFEQKDDIPSSSDFPALHDDNDAGAGDTCSADIGSWCDPTVQLDPDKETHSHSAAMDSFEMYSVGDFSHPHSSELFCPLPRKSAISSNASFRQSVDMDVDNVDTTEHVSVSDTERSATCSVPPTLPQAGPAGESRVVPSPGLPVDTSSSDVSLDTILCYSQHDSRAVPASVITKAPTGDMSSLYGQSDLTGAPAVQSPSRYSDSVGVSMQVSSPREIRSLGSSLACMIDTTVPFEQDCSSTAIRKDDKEQPFSGSTSSLGAEAKEIHSSFSESTQTRYGPPSISYPWNESGDVSQAQPQGVRPGEPFSWGSERSQNNRQYAGGSIADWELEEQLEEEEWSVYACRLLACANEPCMSSDRQELPDPVATLLTEGDHMHFIPIDEEHTDTHPTETQHLANCVSHSPG